MRLLLIKFIFCVFLINDINAQSISFYEKKVGDHKVIMGKNYSSDKTYEVTMTYTCTGHRATKSSPFIQVIYPNSEVEFVSFIPIEGLTGSCSVSYTYKELRSNKAKESPGYNTNEMIVFGKNNCPRCDYFIKELRKKGVIFQELNIDDFKADEDLMWEKLEEYGFTGNTVTAPVVIADNRIYFNVPDMDVLLQIILK